MENLYYTHDKSYVIKENTLRRIQNYFTQEKNVLSTSVSREDMTVLNFELQKYFETCRAKMVVSFDIKKLLISKISVQVLHSESISPEIKPVLNKYDLKYYVLEVMEAILCDENNDAFKRYTIRTYSRYFNSHPIRSVHLINAKFKFFINPYQWTSKEEPMTEQILMLDIEVSAISIEHARSIAYNYTKDVLAYFSILLDVGFEMVSSEFRFFCIKQNCQMTMNRYRTGFLDESLNLMVKDNHYGLKEATNMLHIDSFQFGKQIIQPEVTDGISHSAFVFPPVLDNSRFLEDLFLNHRIKKELTPKGKPASIKPSVEPHNPSDEIQVPSCIRKFYKNINALSENVKMAFDSCSRMYNISLTIGKYNPTVEKSYKVCAIEALAKSEKISFSDFMEKYAPSVDKNLIDYYYNIRSEHFHSGMFYFNEYAINFQREIDFSLMEKTRDYLAFNSAIRLAIINWVNKFILQEQNFN